MDYDVNDLHSMALCVWKEARGEGQLGMQAVAHVIKNRVGAAGFPHTLHDVIFQKNAFTSMSVPSDPEYSLQPPATDPQWIFCVARLCPAVLAGTDADPTNNAKYYANLRTATSSWFGRVIAGPDGSGTPEHKRTAVIGQQSFFS
jgi:N-acetylmuramoyl-L-alanine amidase